MLLGDEQESNIDKYLNKGDLFALFCGEVRSVCVVTRERDGVLEIQNLATHKQYQNKGFASRLIEYIEEYYNGDYKKIILGTGDVPKTLAFYKHRGFNITHRVPDYFIKHYDHPIIEDGILLKDKIYLEKKLKPKNNIESEPDKERQARIYPIILSEYNPEWQAWFEEEKELLAHLIGNENIKRISHIGSTSVPGITAKPTIDILLEIKEDTDIEKLIAALPDSQYICLRQQTMKSLDAVMFLKGYTDIGFAKKVYHIHVRYPGDYDELHFRDYLAAHPEAAGEYSKLKRSLIKDFEHDRDGYTAAKSDFIKLIMKKIR